MMAYYDGVAQPFSGSPNFARGKKFALYLLLTG